MKCVSFRRIIRDLFQHAKQNQGNSVSSPWSQYPLPSLLLFLLTCLPSSLLLLMICMTCMHHGLPSPISLIARPQVQVFKQDYLPFLLPQVIFIDEIDSVCRQRSSKEEEYTRRIKTELLRQMEGADSRGGGDVFLLCATNCPWELDPAFLRRFQKRIFIQLPCRLIYTHNVEVCWHNYMI